MRHRPILDLGVGAGRTGFLPRPEVFEDALGHHVQTADDLRPVFSFNVLARKPG